MRWLTENAPPEAFMRRSSRSGKESRMPDLSIDFCGIKSPNPFWLASGPPTNTAYQVRNAFEVGWGGAVWKTLTDDPIVNVASRYGGGLLHNQEMMGVDNNELVTGQAPAGDLSRSCG